MAVGHLPPKWLEHQIKVGELTLEINSPTSEIRCKLLSSQQVVTLIKWLGMDNSLRTYSARKLSEMIRVLTIGRALFEFIHLSVTLTLQTNTKLMTLKMKLCPSGGLLEVTTISLMKMGECLLGLNATEVRKAVLSHIEPLKRITFLKSMNIHPIRISNQQLRKLYNS